MRPNARWQTGVAAVAGGLALISGAGPLIASGTGAGPIQLLLSRQLGNLVEVVLLNPANVGANGTLTVQAIVHGQPQTVAVPFATRGGQRVSIRAVFSGPVEQILRVGIIVDDGAPF